MSKRSRRPGRRNRPSRIRTKVEAGQLKIVIATTPTATDDGEFLNLDSDLRLVRSALLYADVVELLSPGVAMFTGMAQFSGQGIPGMADVFDQITDDALRRMLGDPNADLEAIRSVSRLAARSLTMGRGGSRNGRVDDLDRLLAEQFEKVAPNQIAAQQRFGQAWVDLGGEELTLAAEAGALRLSSAPLLQPTGPEMSKVFTAELIRLLADPRTHLLLDDDMASFAGFLVDGGHAQPHQLVTSNILKTRTGTGLTARLPAFETSPIESILTARRDLAEPLARYRRAVVMFSDKLDSTPFDNPGLDAELDDLWHDEIQPALADLRRDLSVHDLIRDWVVESASDLKALLTGGASTAAGLVMGAGVIPDVPSLFGHAIAGVGLALPPTIGIANAFKERRPAKRADLFYLHELNRKI